MHSVHSSHSGIVCTSREDSGEAGMRWAGDCVAKKGVGRDGSLARGHSLVPLVMVEDLSFCPMRRA